MSEHIFIFFITCAEYNKLYILRTNLIHDICHKVKSFLVCKSWYNTNHEFTFILCKSKFFLKCNLVLPFLLTECNLIIISHKTLICLRIVYIIIDTIYNTRKTISTCIHKSIKMLSVKRSLYLFRICGTYSCNSVSIYNSAL